MSEFVVWFDSSETGAPVLNNAPGSLIGVLDACLITGFNTKSVTSITVAAGVATATCNGHGFSGVYGKDVLISGATPAALNGRKELTFVDTNTFRFATTAANGAATGTITAKRDPLGWVKQFTGVNKAIYKRTDVAATSMMLRIEDTNAGIATATDARARMVESATDIDTLVGLCPTDAQVTGGHFWAKGSNSATAKTWVLVGDSKRFYIITSGNTIGRGPAFWFGDFQTFKQGDAYNCLLCGSATAYSGSDSPDFNLGKVENFVAGGTRAVVARPASQVGSAMLSSFVGIGIASPGVASSPFPVYPSPVDSGVCINPQILLLENNISAAYPPRGIQSGICQLVAKLPFTHLQIIEPILSLPGRKLLALTISGGNETGQIAADITGPWL